MSIEPKNRRVSSKSPPLDDGANDDDVASQPSAEADATGPDPQTSPPLSTGKRHWLKYAGIGSRPKAAGVEVSGNQVTSLGSLEAEVLGLLWEIGRPATSMEVMETSLYKRRARGEEPASFATIATTLRRLASKNLLSTRKNKSRTPVYYPTVGREQMAARILNNVSQTLLGMSLHGLLPKLIGRSPVETESAEEEENLRRLMDALEQVARTDTSGAAGRDERGPEKP